MTTKTPQPHLGSSGRLIGLVVMPLLFVMIVVCAISLFKSHQKSEQIAQKKHDAFQQWVEWRSEHCRFHGTLASGTFVCDNGSTYRASSGRYGEVKRYPRFVDGLPEREYVKTRP